jgi:hypothetical protein
MALSPVDSGGGRFNVSGFSGPGTGSGSFQPAANTSVNVVTDVNVPASANIIFSPANAAAGLLARSSTLFISTGNSAGSFTFNSSATGGTPPTGSETFAYFYTQENA